MDVSTSNTPLPRSEHLSPFVPDDSRRRQLVHPIYSGIMDDNPYTPLLYHSPRLGSARRDFTTTLFLIAVLVLTILYCFLTIEAAFDSYQISSAVRHSLWPPRHAVRLRKDSRLLNSPVPGYWLSLLRTKSWSVKPGGKPLHRYQEPPPLCRGKSQSSMSPLTKGVYSCSQEAPHPLVSRECVNRRT
jgi:hypothetical protein